MKADVLAGEIICTAMEWYAEEKLLGSRGDYDQLSETEERLFQACDRYRRACDKLTNKDGYGVTIKHVAIKPGSTA